MRLISLELTNFLSYRKADLQFNRVTTLVGPNASGKSNAVAAMKLLRDIPVYGLQTAVARRGGFDQLRHRSEGRPYDPALKIRFEVDPGCVSEYELRFAALAGARYEVKLERARLVSDTQDYWFEHRRGRLDVGGEVYLNTADTVAAPVSVRIPQGQSALGVVISNDAFYPLWNLLMGLQVVEIVPWRVRELQDPTPSDEMQPDGSNTASVFEGLNQRQRTELVENLAAVVPGLAGIEPRRFSNKLTLAFTQLIGKQRRVFLANQMSDGTLRAFGILLSLVQRRPPVVVVIEEPEVAVHLGALRTLVDILVEYSSDHQIMLTTHSADIIDALDVSALRVVWSEVGASRVRPVASHTIDAVRTGMVDSGELLRADALDPA